MVEKLIIKRISRKEQLKRVIDRAVDSVNFYKNKEKKMLLNYKCKEVDLMADKTKAEQFAEHIKDLQKLGYDVKVKTESDEGEEKPTDETKGTVGDKPEAEEATVDESLVIALAGTGKGFEIYSDYTKLDSNRYKRLTR